MWCNCFGETLPPEPPEIVVPVALMPDWLPEILDNVPPGFERRAFMRNWRAARLVITPVAHIVENTAKLHRVIAYHHDVMYRLDDEQYDENNVLRPTSYPTPFAVRVRLPNTRTWADYVPDDDAHLMQLRPQSSMMVVLDGELHVFMPPERITRKVLPKLILSPGHYQFVDALESFDAHMRQVAAVRLRATTLELLQLGVLAFRGNQIKITEQGMAMLRLTRLAVA